jgi:hypothetical protein
MGGKCSKCSECPKCPECSESLYDPTKSYDPTTARIVKGFVIKFIESQAGLLHMKCPGNSMCDQFTQLIPNPVTCTMKIEINSLNFSNKIKVESLDFKKQGELIVESTIVFGSIHGIMTISPTEQNCGHTGKYTAKTITCRETNYNIGTHSDPVTLHVVIKIGENLVPTIDVFELKISDISVECFKKLTHSVEWVRTKLITQVEKLVGLYIQNWINKLMLSAVS